MSVAPTALQNARAFIKPQNVDTFEQKFDYSNIIEAYLADREFTIPSLSSIRSSTTQVTEALYQDKFEFTDVGAKTCDPAGETPGSDTVTLTWTDISVELALSKKVYAGNEIAYTQALANGLMQAEKSIFDILESQLLTHLEANLSGVNNGGSGTFDAANDIMPIANSDLSRFYNLVGADMDLNNYPGERLFHIHDTMWDAERSFYLNQGSQNSTNTNFQFDRFTAYPSNKIPGNGTVIGANTYQSIGYVIPASGVAILDWNDPVNLSDEVHGIRHYTTFRSMVRPEFTFDVMLKKDCIDSTGIGGAPQDPSDIWQITFTHSEVVQPTAATDAGAILKYGVIQ